MNLRSKIYKLLRKSEKYFKTDMVYLVRGMFWLTLSQIISVVSAFVLAIAFANLLPKETYGAYKYILSLTGVLSVFTLPGFSTALTQAAARGYEGSFYQAFRIKLKWGTLSSLAALFLAGYYFFKGNHTLPIPLLISAAFLPLWQASSIYSNFLTGKKLFNFEVKYSAIKRIISVGTMIGALLLTKNLFWIIAVYFASNTLSNYFLYLLTKKKFHPNKKEDPQTISYGKHLSLMAVIRRIADYLDRILIFHYLGAAEVAVYSIAIAPPEQIKGILKSVNILALPKFAPKATEEIKKGIAGKMLKFGLLVATIVALYVITAPSIYKLLFPRYLESVFYSQLFTVSLLTATATLPLSALQAKIETKRLYYLNTFGSIFEIIILLLLVPVFGILGAILARIIYRFFALLFVTALFLKSK